MIRTWSIEEVLVRACSAAAVGVQAVLDFGGQLERLTRPMGHDHDEVVDGCIGCGKSDCGEKCSNAAYYRGADWLADKEAEEEVADPYCRLKAGLDCRCPDCVEAESNIPPLQDDPVAMRLGLVPDKRPVRNEYEPGLTDDELVGVRGILQERYGTTASDAEFEAAYAVERERWSDLSLADDCSLGQDLRGGIHTGAAAQPNTPAADHRPAGISGSEVSDATPLVSPSDPCLDPSRGNRLASVRGEGPGSDSGIPRPPEPGHPPCVADLRIAADIIGSAIGHPADPRDYDYAALAERLSAAAEDLAAQEK